jgi:hypothetical protein
MSTPIPGRAKGGRACRSSLHASRTSLSVAAAASEPAAWGTPESSRVALPSPRVGYSRVPARGTPEYPRVALAEERTSGTLRKTTLFRRGTPEPLTRYLAYGAGPSPAASRARTSASGSCRPTRSGALAWPGRLYCRTGGEYCEYSSKACCQRSAVAAPRDRAKDATGRHPLQARTDQKQRQTTRREAAGAAAFPAPFPAPPGGERRQAASRGRAGGRVAYSDATGPNRQAHTGWFRPRTAAARTRARPAGWGFACIRWRAAAAVRASAVGARPPATSAATSSCGRAGGRFTRARTPHGMGGDSRSDDAPKPLAVLRREPH